MGIPTPATLDVLANDTGGTGTPSITSVGAVPYGTVSIQSPTTTGGRPTLLFTASSGYLGTESFNYTATDAAGASSTASVTVTVTNNAGARPVVAGLSANSGSTLGGSALTINGTGFNSVSAVMFGTVPASFTMNSSSQISVITPAHSAGTVDVIVITSMGSSGINSNDQFAFQAPTGLPTISGVTPGTANISGGTLVTITGTNFGNLTGVNFGSTPATSYTLTSSTTIQATAPSHVAGQVDVTVVTSVGTSAISSGDTILYTTPVLAPSVTGLSASSGPTVGGNTISVLGANFTNVTSVNFGNISAPSFTLGSANSLTVVVPAGVAGTVNVTVTNSAGTSTPGTAAQYTFLSSLPTITSLSVTSGSSNGGTAVTITGTNLSAATKVWFGTVAASQFSVVSPTSIVALSPAAAIGMCDITVQSSTGTSVATVADRFTFLAPPPTITRLSVSSGVISGGTTVILTGDRLANATGVLFGSSPAASFMINADGTVTAATPMASLGLVDVTVTSPSGTSATGAADQFTFINPPPIINSLSVTTASMAGGETVTIHGRQLIGSTSVLVGNLAAPTFSVLDDGTITFVTPAVAAGTVDVTVINRSGRSTTSNADQLTFVNTAPGGSVGVAAPNVHGLPVIAAINPSSTEPTVTLYGTGFNAASAVTFGNLAAPSFQIVSDNQIVATVPAQMTGTVNVAVSAPAGTSAATGASRFTSPSAGAAPVVTAIATSPNMSGPGSLLTITGSNFSNASGLTVGGQPAPFVVQSATTILAQVPAGVAGPANVAVTNASGTSANSPGSQLIVGTPASSTGSGSGKTGNLSYVVPDSAGVPTFAPMGNVSGSTGPSSMPAPPAVPSMNPVTTYDYVFGNGSNVGTMSINVTTTDSGTITGTSTAIHTLANGAVETITTTMTQILSYYSFGSLASSTLDLSLQTILLSTDILVAADGSGFSKLDTSTTTQTYHSSSSGGATDYSMVNVTTSMNSDYETGVSDSSGKDHVSVSLVQSNTTVNFSSGHQSAAGTLSGQFGSSSLGSDAYGRSDTFDDTNIVAPDISSSGSGSGSITNSTRPEVTALLVTGGSTSGGTTVQITGNHFEGATAVKFGSVNALNFRVISDHLIVAVAPPAIPATVHVTVVGLTETSIATKNDLYSYLASGSSLYAIHDFQSITGFDFWQGGSSGTFTLNTDGSRVVYERHGGTSSGYDLYQTSQVEMSLSVGADATGSTSLYDSVKSSDTGFDEYQFSNQGTISIAASGTRTTTNSHNNSDDGYEHIVLDNVGWQQSDETLKGGTVVNYHDDFADSFDDSSSYADSDVYSAGTANGGSGTIRLTSNDLVKFSSRDQVDETDTLTNSAGTPTVARTTDVSRDAGTLTTSSLLIDVQTVGTGEANLGDVITFLNSAFESDIATDTLTITITANGPVSPTESLSLSELITSTSLSSSGSSLIDSGTASILPSGSTESDVMTIMTTSTDSSLDTDTLSATDTITATDGSTSTLKITSDSVDSIMGGSSSSLIDRHTENPAPAGSSSSTPVVVDDITFLDLTDSSDSYLQFSGVSLSVMVPLSGGSSSITASTSLFVSGTAKFTAKDSGEVNTGNPAINNEIDTLSISNVDSGWTKSESKLRVQQTDPATGVVITILSSDIGSSTFSDDDGLSLTNTLAAGSTAPSQSGTSHAISTEGYNDTSTLSISVIGSPSNGVTIDDGELMTDIATGGNKITVQETLTGNVDTGWLKFNSFETDTITDDGHASLTNSISSSDASGNSAGMSDFSSTVFSNGGSLQVLAGGGESFTFTAGKLTSDSESDTTTVTSQFYPSQTTKTGNLDTKTTVDPVTGLIKTQTLIASSTDTVNAIVGGSWTEVHTGSLGQPDTDVITGGSTSTGTELASSSLTIIVTLVGVLATGERVNLTNKYVQNDNSSDGFVLKGSKTDDGTKTQTTTVSGTFNIPTIYNAEYGTISTTNAATGITTTTMIANVIDTNASETVVNGSTTVTPASGAARTTPGNTGTGTLQQGWSLTTIVYQTNAAGVPVGNITTTSDQGSNKGSVANGVITNPGLTNSHIETTSTAGTTTPALPTIPAPGGLAGANTNPPAGAQQGANANVNAVQQAAQGVQNGAMAANQQAANVPGAAAGGNPQQAAGGQHAMAGAPASPQLNTSSSSTTITTDFNPDFIPVDRIVDMGRRGLARTFNDPNDVAENAVTIRTAMGIIVLQYVPEQTITPFQSALSNNVPRVRTIPAHYRLVNVVPSTLSDSAAAGTAFIDQNVKNSAESLMRLEVALATLPGGSAADNLAQGNYAEGGVLAAQDIAMAFMVVGKTLQVSGKACMILSRINQTVQVGTATYRFTEGVQMLAEGGHSWAEISAKTGEGFLALLGARVTVCFPAGTQVAVGQSVNAQGQIEYRTTAIETLKAGDFVLAREEFGPAVKPQPILATYERQSNHLVMISLRDRFGRTQTITTTDDHPFWVVELAAYLKPQDLSEGMSVIGPNEERQSVIAVHREDHPEWVPVYNLAVDQFHTYFVSQSTVNLPVLVHNTDGEDCAKAVAAKAKAAANAPNSVDPAATRPKLRKATKEQARAAAPKTPDGNYIDPNTGQVVPKEGPFDYGHPAGQEWWRLRDKARAEGWTREQVIEAENAKKFQIEDRSSNRGHQHEQPR